MDIRGLPITDAPGLVPTFTTWALSSSPHLDAQLAQTMVNPAIKNNVFSRFDMWSWEF